MLTVKRFDGNYTLESIAGSATITLGESGNSDTVIIPGDLTVNGTTTTVNSTNLAVSDNTIIINDGETGPGITHVDGTAGISVDRGDGVSEGEEPAVIYFHEGTDKWRIDQGDGIELDILALPPGGTALQNIVEDLSPQLGANLDVNAFAITATASNNVAITTTTTGNIVLTTDANGEIQLAGPVMIQGAAPNVTPDGTEAALFHGTDTGGGTRIHFENDTTTDELISKGKALVYSLVL